jgi:hypothetical protein
MFGDVRTILRLIGTLEQREIVRTPKFNGHAQFIRCQLRIMTLIVGDEPIENYSVGKQAARIPVLR